jgi:uncharacterized membrane protein YhaH (DUF805 family)
MDLKWFLLSFEGRINRKPFWIFNIVVAIIAIILELLFGINIIAEEFDNKSLIFFLIVLGPSLAVQAKRWHDRNKSAWWILVNFVPIIGPIYALIQNGFLTGTKGKNRFGDDPLGYESTSTYNEQPIFKPITSSPISEKDMIKKFKEFSNVVLVALVIIFLVVLGTWVYLTYIKK